MIIPTQEVSYPRSGSILLNRMLETYFEKEICWPNERKNDKFYGQINNKINLAKNHDFYKSLKIKDDKQYLLLYRNPVRVLVSHFRMVLKNSTSIGNFNSFIHGYVGIPLWKQHINRWVMNSSINSLKIKYEDLVLQTFNTFKQIIVFLSKEEINKERFMKSINIPEIRMRLNSCGFYDENLFDNIENKLSKEMKQANIISYRDLYSV